MGKSDLTSLLTLVILFEFSIWVFLGNTMGFTVLMDLFVNGVSGGSDFTFYTWLSNNFLGAVALGGTILIGTFIATKNEFGIYAGFTAVFFSYIITFFKIGTMLSTEFDRFFSISGGGFLLAMVFTIGLGTLYMMAILRFWRGLE